MGFPLLDRHGIRVRDCRHGAMAYLQHDQFVGRSLDQLGEFSEGEVAVARRYLQPGATALDVGANIGALTVPLAALVGPAGRVVAFEPQRVLFQLLCANLALNGHRNVQALNAAAGIAPGVLDVPAFDYQSEGNFGGINLTGEFNPAQAIARPPERVPVRPLDELGLERLDFLKIDVEGMENQVLLGAVHTLERCRPTILLENDREDRSAALIQTLLTYRYRLYWHLTPLYSPANYAKSKQNPWPGIVSINMLAVPAEKPQDVGGLREVSGPEASWREGIA